MPRTRHTYDALDNRYGFSISVQPGIDCTTFQFFKIFKSWQVYDWLAKWMIMLRFMDLRWPRVYRRSNVGLVPAAVGFRQIILISHANILYYNVGNHRNNCKTAFICPYSFVSHTLRLPQFLARLSTHASPRLFHILTSFVCTSPITMLTSRPRHGP